MPHSAYERGLETLAASDIIICSIVRDCEKNLKRNIPLINTLCGLAKSYKVVVFENDSKDRTKQILIDWAENDSNVHISVNDFRSERTIPYARQTTFNPFFTRTRIEKMAVYRNQYLEYIENNKLKADFVIIADLDVARISIEGIVDTFGLDCHWDAVFANGQSISPKNLKLRFHDTYALCVIGKENQPQTEEEILSNTYRWATLKKGDPLVSVYSAFGGLGIYRYECIKGLRYDVVENKDNDGRVEVKCEHFDLHDKIHKRGYNSLFINPSMTLKYQHFTFGSLCISLLRRIGLYPKEV